MDALAMVGLEKFAESYPRELSGGMKMRVSIARALITRPKLLLMDEPFAALDEITRFKLNDDLLHLWETFGWTVIFVTHSVFESAYLSNRIVVMAARPGRVFADLSVDAVYPRGEAFRMSAEYNEYCRRTSDALHNAMAAHS
jgi:NitT/TauT family transport system ATP-binding protein